MKTISRPTPYQLAKAITGMAGRYGEAERQAAYAYSYILAGHGDRAEYDRWRRACTRRFAAIQRLTDVLCEQADTGPEDGHRYECCGKVGRISRHETWCPTLRKQADAQ